MIKRERKGNTEHEQASQEAKRVGRGKGKSRTGRSHRKRKVKKSRCVWCIPGLDLRFFLDGEHVVIGT